MNFSDTEEQKILRQSVRKLLARDCPFETYRSIVASEAGHSPELWRQFAELQWLALPFPEAEGGFGAGPSDLLVFAEELGRGLCVEPYLANVVLAGTVIARAGSATQRGALLPGLIDGSRQVSLAWAEAAGRYDLAHCDARAVREDGEIRLNGAKSVVLNAPNAETLVVVARMAGEVAERTGLSLYGIPRDAPGVEVRGYPLLGGGVAGEVSLRDVRVAPDALIGREGGALEVLEDAIDLATAVSCADAYGAMQALFERTLEYVKTRKQFGVAIGTFQVIQHRVVDMFLEVEQAQSLVRMAGAALEGPDAVERQKAVSACKSYLHKASKFVAQQAVQLHGGIGVTEDFDVGHYFRRLTAFGNLFGDRDHHLRRFAALTQGSE